MKIRTRQKKSFVQQCLDIGLPLDRLDGPPWTEDEKLGYYYILHHKKVPEDLKQRLLRAREEYRNQHPTKYFNQEGLEISEKELEEFIMGIDE